MVQCHSSVGVASVARVVRPFYNDFEGEGNQYPFARLAVSIIHWVLCIGPDGAGWQALRDSDRPCE